MLNADALNRLDHVEAVQKIQKLKHTYWHYNDTGLRGDDIADLFTEDGVWTSPELTMDGREEIEKGMGQRQANTARMSRHVCNNLLVDVIDEDHAEGTVYLTLYRHDGEPGRQTSPLPGAVMVGEYRDRFVRTPDGWRIAHREIGVSFLRREAPPA